MLRASALRLPPCPPPDSPRPASPPPLSSPSAPRRARRAHLQPKALPPGAPPHVTARRAWREWRALGASRWTLRVLTAGLLLPWRRPPPPHKARPIHQPPEVLAWAVGEVRRWVALGYCRPATPAEAAAAQWEAASFVTDIAHRPRLVVDLSAANAWLHDRRFRYETLPAFVCSLKRGDHMASWDVRDAFHHIHLAPREGVCLAFRVGGALYIPLTLPFGLKLAPWALTKLLRPVVAHLRSRGYLVLPYMDDFAVSVNQREAVTAAQATAARAFCVALFTRLGLQVHPDKGIPTRTTRLEILGFVIDTERCLLLLPPKRQAKLIGAAHSLLRAAALDRRWVRTRALRRFCGLASSAALAIPLGRHHLRPLFLSLAGVRCRSRLSSAALRALVWWASVRSAVGIGRSLWEPQAVAALDTDACPYGWGAVRDAAVPARGFFDLASRHYHINRKELLAIVLALESFPSRRGPGVVRVRTDSRVVRSVVNSLFSRSPALHADVIRLAAVLRERRLGIEATWLPSVENRWADRLSRERDTSDWRLALWAWAALDAAWGPLTIDRFATTLNTQLPRFNSAVACPGAEAVDAYAQPWGGERNYCNPPFAQAAVALRKCWEERATAVFVLPVWPAQPWWALAVRRATATVLLPPGAALFTGGRYSSPATPPSWRTAAFLFEQGGTLPTAPAGAACPPVPPWPPSAPPGRGPPPPPPS